MLAKLFILPALVASVVALPGNPSGSVNEGYGGSPGNKGYGDYNQQGCCKSSRAPTQSDNLGGLLDLGIKLNLRGGAPTCDVGVDCEYGGKSW